MNRLSVPLKSNKLHVFAAPFTAEAAGPSPVAPAIFIGARIVKLGTYFVATVRFLQSCKPAFTVVPLCGDGHMAIPPT
jgi:hypothetical protein